jgi:hypothetical protein
MKQLVITGAIATAFLAGFLLREAPLTIHAQTSPGVYEFRTYTTLDGKLDNLHARFRDHTLELFDRHEMINVAYFSPTDAPLSENTLIYLIAHENREAATASWEAFLADPEWQQVATESQVDGRLVSNIESVFMTVTDYSPMQ